MSLAKVNQIGRVRKPGKCGKCGLEIKVGDPAVRFSVGFRGYTQTRCTKPECFPKPSERESSLVSGVYAAQEDVDVSTAGSLEDLEQIRDDVVNATREVASEYEDSEMYERNYDLQERAETLNAAADTLEEWAPEEDEPGDGEGEVDCLDCEGTGFIECKHDDESETHEDECETCGGTGKIEVDDTTREEWLATARESLQAAIDEMELP